MKSKLYFIGLVIIVVVFSFPSSLIAQEELFIDNESFSLTIEDTLSGSATDTRHPAAHLTDGNEDSYWSFNNNSEQGWVELELEKEALIYGLKISGEIMEGCQIQVEYKKDDFWQPFLGSLTELSGSETMDLSGDRVVSDHLRIRVFGDDIAGVKISEVKVLGKSEEKVFHKIKPAEIIVPDENKYIGSPHFLIDGNTNTIWESDPGQEQMNERVSNYLSGEETMPEYVQFDERLSKEVVFNFGENRELKKIDLYFADNTRGTYILEVKGNNGWEEIEYLSEEVQEEGWERIELSEDEVFTDQVRILVEEEKSGGISEVNFWGYNSFPGDEHFAIGSQKPSEVNELIYREVDLNHSQSGEYFLELAVAGDREEELPVVFNGRKLELEPEYNLRGETVYRYHLADNELRRGTNFLQIKPADEPVTLITSRIRKTNEFGRTVNLNSRVSDGYIFSQVSGDITREKEITLSLDEHLETDIKEFPELPPLPTGLDKLDNLTVDNWSQPTVIDSDGYYDRMEVLSELEIETGNKKRVIRVKDLILGPDAEISLKGSGKVELYIENDLHLNNSTRINPGGDKESLQVYHYGEEVSFQGRTAEKENKFAGKLYTRGDRVLIENGVRLNGDLYVYNGNAKIAGDSTVFKGYIYVQNGNINLTTGAELQGTLLGSNGKIVIDEGAKFDGSDGKLQASESSVKLGNGAIVRGDIFGDPANIEIGYINFRESYFSIPETGNFNSGQEMLLEEVKIYSPEPDPDIGLEGKVDGRWMEIADPEVKGGEITYSPGLVTEEIKLRNPLGLPISEVVLKGSEITDREPEIEILTPDHNELIGREEIAEIPIIAYVDNLESEVKINGLEAEKYGHYFWMDLSRLDMKLQPNNLVVASARDEAGRVNSDYVNIQVGEEPGICLDQDDELIYTEENSIKVSGSLDSVYNQLKINGHKVPLSGDRFSADIELEEGYNLLEIEALSLNHQGKMEFNTKVFREVVRRTAPLEITVSSPPVDYYTAEREIIITGRITNSLGEPEVKINGRKAEVDGISYTSHPVELEDGKNEIEIEAYDESRQTLKEISVVRDVAPPELEIIRPEANYISRSPRVLLKGKVFNQSPVDVFVNGMKSMRIGDYFYQFIYFPSEGYHSIDIKAVDKVGNTSTQDREIMVDNSPPESFTVEVEPSGWTNNNQPEITFNTSDKISGIDYYEYAVDDSDYKKIKSPFKLPSLKNGVHEVKVRAVDRAGWKTTATAKMYIDTKPPELPQDFRAVPGRDLGAVRWEEVDSAEDSSNIKEYKIKRDPGWTETETKVLKPEDVRTFKGEMEFIDEDVVPGEEYSYQIQVVDDAGNRSNFSEPSTIKAGKSEEEVNPEGKTEAEFYGAEVEIPEEGISEEGVSVTIEEVEEGDAPAAENNTASETYDINLTSGAQIEDESLELDEAATLKINYKDLDFDGYSPLDLNIYYFDPDEERWLLCGREEIDPVKQEITFETEHFSMFNVQVTENYSPAEEDYEELGDAPYKSYVENNEEQVSPANGNLNVNATDIVLPGRNGLDLKISRIFDGGRIAMEKMVEARDSEEHIKGYKGFGEAWNINLPWIETNERGHFVHLEDGSFHKVRSFSSEFRQYSEGRFFQYRKAGDGYQVIDKTGKKYEFDADGKIKEIVDRTGENSINYHYNGEKIDKIVDSVGREVEFNYSGDLISKINIEDRQFTYHYNGEKLESVIDPEERVTEYDYTSRELKFGATSSDFDDAELYTPEVPLVDKIVYPTGAESIYNYDEQVYGAEKEESESAGVWYYGEWIEETYSWTEYDYTSFVVDSQNQLLDEKKNNSVDYDYEFNEEYSDYRVLETNLEKDARDELKEFNKQGLTTRESIFSTDGEEELEKKIYQYDTETKQPITEEVYKLGEEELENVYGRSYEYDSWGNRVREVDTGTGLTVKTHYYNTDSSGEEYNLPFDQEEIDDNIKNLPAARIVYNDNPREGTIKHESAYSYDSRGNMLAEARYLTEEDRWITAEYEYDKYGNKIKEIKPEGNVVEYEYSSDYGHAFSTREIRYRGEEEEYIKDADGNQLDSVVYRYEYDPISGEPVREIDPEGNQTDYEYDKLGRMVKEIYPENRETGTRAVKLQYYDDEENTTTVANAENVEQVELTADGIRGELFNKSKYYYDGLNRCVRLEQYLLEDGEEAKTYQTRFEYDSVGNKVKTIDAEKNETRYEYNEFGRKIKIIYPDQSYTEINYNDRENSRTIIDPERNKTVEEKDWNDEVVRVSKFNEGEEYTSYAAYDSLGNRISVTDAEGHTTDYYYDSLNRRIKEDLPEDEYIVEDSVVNNYRPTIEYEYDDNNNRVVEIDPRGARTNYTFDELDREIIIEDEKGQKTKKYYNGLDKEIKTEYPNGSTEEVVYDHRGNEIAEIDGEGHVTYSEYDIVGEKTATYDPRGVEMEEKDGEFEFVTDDQYKTSYEYNSLGWKVKTSYPGEKVHDEEIIYDRVGNEKRIIRGDRTTEYEYNDLYFRKEETVITGEETRTTSYEYDKVGNKVWKEDNAGNVTEYEYDDLYRKDKVINPDLSTKEYTYDRVGNKTGEKDGENNWTEFTYNSRGLLTEVDEPEAGVSRYYYDPGENLVKRELSDGLVTRYEFDILGQMEREIKPGNQVSEFTYNEAGNLETEIGPRGIKNEYKYEKDNQLRRINYYASEEDEEPENITKYNYDQAGNRTGVEELELQGESYRKKSKIKQQYDPLDRVESETRVIDDREYSTGYRYDRYGNLEGIKYPDSDRYLEFGHDELGQLRWIEDIAGSKEDYAFVYDEAGNLEEKRYDNNLKTKYRYDDGLRPELIQTFDPDDQDREKILEHDYKYDGAGNLTRRNDNHYDYDSLNRLEEAEVKGRFYVEDASDKGYIEEDLIGDKRLDFQLEEIDELEVITFDYFSTSIGVRFPETEENISKIELTTLGRSDHRIEKRHLDILYTKEDNSDYVKLSHDRWELQRHENGNLIIRIPEEISARCVKVNNHFDERDEEMDPVNQGEFSNVLSDLISVYRKETQAEISYGYDRAGNRTRKEFSTASTQVTDYTYEEDTHRLISNGEYAYKYDETGNLIAKGNKFEIQGDQVEFTATEGPGVEYWEYEYNLQNRLSKAYKNDELIAEFTYNDNGQRIKSSEKTESGKFKTTYYAYSHRGQVLLEEVTGVDSGRTSYVYALDMTYARIDGVIGGENWQEEVIYFHHDNLGSTVAMTDTDGEVVMRQDYLPFGNDLPLVEQSDVLNEPGEGYKYTGQKQVRSIGLYYYNARWYDPDIGRFNREDDYQGELENPQSQNLYVYVQNNPLVYVDPTGNMRNLFGLGTPYDNFRSGFRMGKEFALGAREGDFTRFKLQTSMEWNRRSANFWSDVGAVSEGADDFGQWINRNQETVNLIPFFGLGVNIGQGIDKAAFGSDYYFEGDRGFMDWAADTSISGVTSILAYEGASALILQYKIMSMGNASTSSTTTFRNTGAIKTSDINVKSKSGVGVKGTTNLYSKYAEKATKYSGSPKVVLGKYSNKGLSYHTYARKKSYTHFDLKNYNELMQKVGQENMWNINKEFLARQISSGKDFILTHNPHNATGSYGKEIKYLAEKGYTFVQEGEFWKAIK